MTNQAKVKRAIEDFRQGKMVIIMDDEDRENEGDLVASGSLITPETVNFMIKKGRGLVCAPISLEIAERLNLPQMAKENTEYTGCQFTISIDYKHGTTTGISAFDRAKTLNALADPTAKPKNFTRPGHIFPLASAKGGIRERRGQTEASIELAHLAGLPPVGVICEIIKDDGTMAREGDLKIFADKHNLALITVQNILDYLTL